MRRRQRSRSKSPSRTAEKIERQRSPPRRQKEETKESGHAKSEDFEKPNFSTSGLLVKEANTFNGILLKYSEPPEARKCDSVKKLRLYTFKGDEHIDTIPIYKQSAYLLGRERYTMWKSHANVVYSRKVCDIGFDHASISSQHCVLQYRQIVKTNDFGETHQKIKFAQY